MEMEHLKCFIEIENCMSFTTAAEELYISQSSLSKKILALEKELDIKLFDRSNNRVTLTPEGKIFSLYARKMFDFYLEMVSAVHHVPAKEGPDVRIASIQNMKMYQIDAMIQSFEHKNPSFIINTCETFSDSVLELLKKSVVDMAILRGYNVPENRYTVYPLLSDELVFVCCKAHRLASRTALDLSEAADEHFSLLDEACGLKKLCMDICIKSGFTPKRVTSSVNVTSVIHSVQNNNAVSLLFKKVAAYYQNDNICLVPLENRYWGSLVIATRENNVPLSQPCKDFISYAVNYFSNKK